MICPKCGTENAADAEFCVSCGSALREENQSAKTPLQSAAAKLPKGLNGTILKVAVAAVLVIILIAVIVGISGGRSGDYTFVKQSVTYFSDKNGETTTLFVNGKALKQTIDGSVVGYQASLDNSVVVITASEDGENTLYVLRGKKLTKVAGSEDWSDCVVATSGEGIAYTVKDEEESTLYLYDVSKKKSTKVETSARISCTALSPDGESLTYIMQDEDEDDITGYFFNGKKSVKLGRNVAAIGLSDGGKYIYTVSTDDSTTISLYNKKGEKKNKIGEASDAPVFNEDHTQMLYSSEGKTYISVKGKAGERFFKDSGVTPILPKDSRVVGGSSIATYPVEDFYNLFYYSDNGIYQVKKNYEKNAKLASKVAGGITLSEDASLIYYRNQDGDLNMVKTSWGEKGPEKVVTIAEDVNEYAVTADCSRVYYRDGDELYSVKGKNGKSKKRITDDVSSGIVLGKGDILYFSKDGDIYACSNGKSAKLVLPDGELSRGGTMGYYYYEADDVIYCTTGSKKPKKVFTID